MTKINKDITTVTDGIICHQVNCKKIAGAGVALAIRNKFPMWYTHFMLFPPELGTLDIYNINESLQVASFYSQFGFGRTGVFTNYVMFEKCLQKLAMHKKTIVTGSNIYFPYKIGCGLAGGNWDIILPMIEKYIKNPIICYFA